MDQVIQDRLLLQLHQATQIQNELLAELLALARRSEERQAGAERMEQMIRSAQKNLGEQLANGGPLSEAMKNWRAGRISSAKQNHTTHNVTVNEPELRSIVSNYVAQRLGLDVEAEHVSVRTHVSHHAEGGLGTAKTCVKVELIEDHEAEARAAEG